MAGLEEDALITININDTLEEVMEQLDGFASDQLPFAMAGALYDVAVDAREEMRRQLPKKFTIRQNKPWASRALSFDPISKKKLRAKIKDGGEPSISITSRDKVLGPLLTDGGIRKPTNTDELGVPVIGGGRKTLQTKLTRATGAQGLMAKNKRAIIITAMDGRRLLVTVPAKYQKGVPKAKQHKAMFHMRKFVNLKPWWDARTILLHAMDKQLPGRFVQNFNKALETRK